MIYLQCMAYVAADLALVRQFEQRVEKSSNYWTEDECSAVRTAIKRHYRAVQGNTCCYCRQIIAVDHGRVWDAEHIVPRKSNPSFMFTPQNLALACPDCNGAKSSTQTLVNPSTNLYPTTGASFLIVHPHFDNYADHIEKGEYTYARLSDKGEWTIKTCNLTRLAGRKLGWPDPVADERFEKSVEDLFGGDPTSIRVISDQLRASVAKSQPDPGIDIPAN